MTLSEKIIARAAGKDSVKPGEIVTCAVDLAMMHDSSGPRRAGKMLDQLGVAPWDTSKIVIVTDHYVNDPDPGSVKTQEITRQWVADKKIGNFYPEQGICHVVLPEKGHLKPGMFCVGADSHSTTGGAFTGDYVPDITWDALDRPLNLALGGSTGDPVLTKAYGYDPVSSRLAQLEARIDGTPVATGNYTIDGAGRITAAAWSTQPGCCYGNPDAGHAACSKKWIESCTAFYTERDGLLLTNGGLSCAYVLGLSSPQTVLATIDGNQLVGNTVLLEFTRHDEALLMRHVSVFCPVDHQRGWVLGGDIFGRHEGSEFLDIGLGKATDFFRPDSELAAGLVIRPAIALPTIGIGCRWAGLHDFHLGWREGSTLMSLVGTGLAKPRANQIPIAPIGHQHRGWWLHAKAGGKSEVPACRASQDSNLGSVCLKFFTAVFTNPFKGILNV